LGLFKVKGLIDDSQVHETVPTIGLGPVLQLIRTGTIEIIDMRPPQDYNLSHIKDAFSVHQLASADMGECLLSRLSKARNIVLYSGGGVTPEMRQFAQALSKRGIEGVAFYSGGFREWLAAGLPVETQ